MRNTVTCLLTGALMIIAQGCGPDVPKKYPISGQVSYKGKPVSTGDIIFVPENRSIAPVAGRIKDGQFTAAANEGRYRVEITALDITPNTRVVMGSPMASNYIPLKYNQESTLTIDVSATSGNVFDFPCEP